MYVNVKERINKSNVKVFYLYICESKRVDGKVKNAQRYFGNIKETELIENDFTILYEALRNDKWTTKEVRKVEAKLNEIALVLHEVIS